MLGAEGLLADGQSTLENWLGLSVAARCLVQSSEVVEACGKVGVIRAERLLAALDGLLVQPLGVDVPTEGLIDTGVIVDPRCNLGVVWVKRFLSYWL